MDCVGPYIGRFAPSPTGPLHFGSLVAAIAGWLDARKAGGRWLVRIEDLDAPRVVPGAEGEILRQLEAFGLAWDGEIERQSARSPRYEDALRRLASRTYLCGCTRKELEDSALAIDGARIYPGTCRVGMPKNAAARDAPRAVRLRTSAEPVRFIDRALGEVSQSVEREVGDFVLKRADGLHAYQLAVVVDDDAQGVTDVVRGADLLDSTARQIYLQRLLGARTPRYLHLPVAVNATGEKLSKQTGAAPAQPRDLDRALRFLGFDPPRGLPPRELLDWGIGAWDVSRIPRVRARQLESHSS